MDFQVLPAVDVAGGVLARSGREVQDQGSAIDAGLTFEAAGASFLHLADLDAARQRGSNLGLLTEVIDTVAVPVQLSGGIADPASLSAALRSGCARAVIGTHGLADLGWVRDAIDAHGPRVAVALDIQASENRDGGRIWTLVARGDGRHYGDLWTVIERLDRAGCRRYVITDVDRDGGLVGPNIGLYRAVATVTDTPMLASGGVSNVADLVSLAAIARDGGTPNLDGVVLGTALHAGVLTLQDAMSAVAQPAD